MSEIGEKFIPNGGFSSNPDFKQPKQGENQTTPEPKQTYNPMASTANSEFKVLSDLVELPSKGYFYPNGLDKVMVEYMTARDEQILLTPGLVKHGTAIDMLLSRKIKDKGIDIGSLYTGDKNAILMFLRITAYGPGYDVEVTSPYTYETFKTTVNLNELKYKEITVFPDENLEYGFTLPISEKSLKFKLLTSREEEALITTNEQLMKVNGGINEYNTLILKRRITELDGNRDIERIRAFVDSMSPRDARALRVYVDSVESGIELVAHNLICPSTGANFSSGIYINSEFLYPSR